MRIAAPDAPVSGLADAVRSFVGSEIRLVIGAERPLAASGRTLPAFDPATGAEIARVPQGGAEDIDAAVRAARAALDGEWSRLLPTERQRLILKIADLIDENGEELAQLETLNNGKSVMLSRLVEVASSAEYFRYMAGWATKIEGSTLDVSIMVPPGARYQAYTRREPVGVVGAITPWNFPLTMAAWKIAPALACGCTVVLKPAEETPLTAIRLAELCLDAGLPPGVVNVVTGTGEEAGAALTAHPLVNKLTFTGSTEVGKIIGVQAMKDMKRVTLELGGKAPMVMFDDMDLDQLAAAAGIGVFFNTGQTCCAGTLSPGDDVEIPPNRFIAIPFLSSMPVLDDGRFSLVYNFTPEQSLSVVDLQERKFAGEFVTSGCALAYPTGPRSFFMQCGDGSLQAATLDEAGAITLAGVSKPIFSEDDPANEKPVRTGAAEWLFFTFAGDAVAVDASGETPVEKARWRLTSAEEAGWRIGGVQPAAYHAPTGRLFVLMHEGGEFTHKNPGTEIWVFDVAAQKRVARYPLEKPVTSLAVSGDADPLLYTILFGEPELIVRDPDTGEVLRTIGELGREMTVIQPAPVQVQAP